MRRTHYQSKGKDKFNAKLAAKYKGPYEVLRVLSPTVYEVETKNNCQKAKVDIGDLKPYIPWRARKAAVTS